MGEREKGPGTRERKGHKSGVFSTRVSFCHALNASKRSYLNLSVVMGHSERGSRWKSQSRAQRVKEHQRSKHQSELFTLTGCLVLRKHDSGNFFLLSLMIINVFETSLLITF